MKSLEDLTEIAHVHHARHVAQGKKFLRFEVYLTNDKKADFDEQLGDTFSIEGSWVVVRREGVEIARYNITFVMQIRRGLNEFGERE